MAEIVPADPIIEPNETNRENTLPLTRSVTFGEYHDHVHGHVPEPFDSERLPPTLASEIQNFLRLANLIESDEPRIAYLCRFHAFEIANNLDPNSIGRGVKQFKSALIKRLEQDEESTMRRRKKMSDISEFRHGGAIDLENREKKMNACRIASELHEEIKKKRNVGGVQLKLKKRRKGRGGNVRGTAKLSQQIDRLIEAVESRNTTQSAAVIPSCSVPEVLQLFDGIAAKLSQQIDRLIEAIESRNTSQSAAVMPSCSIPEVMQLFNGIAEKFPQQIDRLIEAFESRNTPQSTKNMPGCSIPEVMRLLNDTLSFEQPLYRFATSLFMVKEKREIFAGLNPRARIGWLYYEQQKEGDI